jgi:hypothetical protein
MSNTKTTRARIHYFGVSLAILISVFGLTACSGGGGLGTAPAGSPPAGPTPTPPPVTAAPVVTLSATPSSITPGTGSTINWSATDSSSCRFTSGTGTSSGTTLAVSGSFNTPTLNTTTTYAMTCTGPGGTGSQSTTVTVTSGTACSTTGATNAITLSNVPSRIDGVAPLSVFFDATGTTATATTRPFHNLEYRWTFGDAAGSPVSGTTWTTGSGAGNSRNAATGPVAAHVFENSGTYTVSLTVTDGSNTVSNNCTQIVVQNPADVFSNDNTVCVAAQSQPLAGSGGCPLGALTDRLESFPAAISRYATTGKRVLFKRGDTFTAATEARITATGPGIVGAYGSGALPLIQVPLQVAAGTEINILGFSSSSTPEFKDWRIMDLDLDGMGGGQTSGTGISSASGGVAQVTVLRLTYRNMNNAIGFALDRLNFLNNDFIANGKPAEATHSVDQVTVVDSTVIPGAATVYSAYDAGNRIAFMGNNFDNGGLGTGSHITRWPFLNKAVISNNTFSRPGSTRLAIKLHAPYWNSTFNVFDPTATQPVIASNPSNYSTYANGDGYSKYVVISDNKLTDSPTAAGNPWSVELGPQDSGSDERIKDVIVERNWWVANTASQVALRISASEVTARNNIFDFSHGSNSQTAIQVVKDGVVITSDQVRLYNNTIYSSYPVPAGQFVGVEVGSIDPFTNAVVPVTNITMRNNLAYAPNAVNPAMLVNHCGACLTQSNNSTDVQVKNESPNFVTMPPVVPADYRPTSGYAIGGGTPVPVWSDFLLQSRPQRVIDIGAIEAP